MTLRALLGCCLPALAAAVWPLPSSYSSGTSVLWIDPSVSISYSGQSDYKTCRVDLRRDDDTTIPFVVQTAINRTYETIFSQNFVPWQFHPRNSDFEPAPSSSAPHIKCIFLIQTAAEPSYGIKPLDGQLDESYTLNMTTDGQVNIAAKTSVGISHALTTFTQFFYAHTEGGVYTNLAPVSITDAPKFAHRGLNMDVARSWFPVNNIMRMIDALAYSKMNRLHLHVTDSQSWPLQIPSMPALADKGAYGKGLSYSPDDISGIQQYGQSVGVEVYLEIDMPGHTGAIQFAYPELITAWNELDWQNYSAEPPSGSLKLNSPAVYDFLNNLWDDLLPRVSPFTAYFHTGGDEVNYNDYALDETVRSNDPTVLRPLLQKFVDFNHARVRAAGLTPVVWEEILLNYNLTVGEDVLVQTWTGESSVAQVTKMGHKAIAGNYNFWYLDCGQGQFIDFEIGVASKKFFPYQDYCSPRHNWREVYSYDPLKDVLSNATHLVVGGEVSMWTEQTDPVNLDRQVWPRAAAAGEVLWSGAKDAQGQNRSQIEASPRLAEMRERLVARGVMAEPVHMPFCTQNGTQCAILNAYA